MRKFLVSLLLVAAMTPACARLGAGPSSAGSGAGISAADALTQAQGAATAIATLAQASPLDDATKAQIQGYAAWADFALRAAGIIATATGL